MKTKNNIKKGSKILCTPEKLIKSLVVGTLIFTNLSNTLQAQEPAYTRPSWWFGAAAGANFNFYRGSTQKLNEDLTVPTAFHSGNGVGLYLAPLVEYHKPLSMWGAMFQAGYDGRSGKFNEIKTPCNCPADLSTKMSYVTIEPSLRFAPFKSNFYLYAGPRLAFNIAKSFVYKQKTNPDYPDQIANPDVKGDLSNVNSMLVSMQIGAGYDINLSSQNKRTQYVLSPFVSFQPYFGQSPRSIESWNITTLRVGAAFKFGRGHKGSAAAVAVVPEKSVPPADVIAANADVQFSINSPKNIPVERRVRETFPLRNYIFFDKGSKEIPSRYVLLKKDEVKDFKEDQLEVLKSKKLSGRSHRQMVAYYNILNILGDRMSKKPTITIKLVGSSEKSHEDGKEMAESVKNYLVNTFGIEGSRITTEGLTKPLIPSGEVNGTHDLELLSEGNRRVSIETVSPTLLMEFESGPDAPLKPVEIMDVQKAPLDSYVTFNVDGGKDEFTSWDLEVKDEKGVIEKFGPYYAKKVSIPGKSILGSRPQGDFNVTMIGHTKSGKTIKKEAPVHMVLWTPGKNEEGMRFSVIFEYDESDLNTVYTKYLTDVVTSKIPQGASVIIHGYTDNIGDAEHNKQLSVKRSKDVRSIIEKELVKSGRHDVKFEEYGFGEEEKLTPFDNKYPEERFYNRTVVVDIIPHS
jgi:outer membrane protein OmpA-like peptidoglycan-associated protein